MTTAQLKSLLVKKINKIDDEDRLKLIKEMIELDEQSEEIYVLNDLEKKLIAKGRDDIKKGKFHSNDEVFDKVDKWLKEK